MTDEKDWKDKYFSSLKQMDELEERWAEVEKLLRKAITRLAITAKGGDSRLDRLLAEIQLHTREQDNEALNDDLKQLSTTLVKLDEPESSARADHDVNFHQVLLLLIDQLKINEENKSRIEELKNSIQNMDDRQSLYAVSQVINQLLLYKPDNSDSAREILITLIEEISLAHGNTDKLDELQERLGDDFTIDEWQIYLDAIIREIQVIIKHLSHEKVDLESLIIEVTHQLGEISEALSDDQSDMEEGRQQSQALQTMMNTSVRNIRSEVSQQTDITILKQAINSNLNTIKTGVESFILKDGERYRRTQERNLKLQQQIRFMEQESDQLQQKLQENRKKLMFDTLTGVRSRLSYDEVLEQELSRYSRYQEVFSFAILDIDHFKRINDQFGHNAGDKALKIVAKMMAQNIRQTDFLFRIGGEEFVLLLPKTTVTNSAALVEKLRGSVGKTSFHFKQDRVDITMSAGLTEMRSGDSAESIYERADKALYRAKNGGRNQLVVAD